MINLIKPSSFSKKWNLYLISIRILFIFSLSSFYLNAQQSPNWSSFYESGFIWNPALTARWNSWELTATSRQEWSGFENAPRYNTIGFQYPFIKNIVKVSLGTFVEMDRVGPYESLGFGATYAYKIYPKLFGQKDGVLTFGITAKVNQFRFKQDKLIGFDGVGNENFVSDDNDNFLNPNLNFGIFYNSVSDFYAHEPHFYFGASINNVIPLENKLAQTAGWKFLPHINLHGGLRMKPSRRSKYYYEPSIMISYVNSKTMNVMAHIRYEMEQKYWGAIGLVSSGEVFGQIGFIFNDRSVLGWLVQDGILRLGTKIDYSIGSLSQFAGIGYEAFIAYTFSNEPY